MRITRRAFFGCGLAGLLAPTLACRADTLTPWPVGAPGQSRTTSGPRGGVFDWRAGDMSEAVANDPAQGIAIAPSSAPSGALGAWVRRIDGPLRPEWFGAQGDGVTNDTSAFAGLATYVNSMSGGEIELSRTTYIVGEQKAARAPGLFAEVPQPILDFRNCRRGVAVRGNGARLKCAPGLRYGTFDPASRAPTRNAMPFYGQGQTSSPYGAMIHVEGSDGPVLVENVELDGNIGQLVLGGPWGDTGWQIPAYGLSLVNNRGSELIRNVHSHHHALDGLLIDGVDAASPATRARRQITDVRCEYNGRQGCSIIGGRGYSFFRCRFAHTGRDRIASAPGAGLDIEAEGGKQVRNLVFEDCEFVDNAGCGMVADSGDSADARFVSCRFVGTTSWSIWPRMPSFRFDDCTFVGAICNCRGDDNPQLATRFLRCTFVDDPALSPSGLIYHGGNREGPIADLSTARNILFDRCRFALTGQSLLPWSTAAIFSGCDMRQASSSPSYPRGIYLGQNRITGNAVIAGSTVRGTLMLNGVQVPRAG